MGENTKDSWVFMPVEPCLWNQDSLVCERNLKSQNGFLQGVADIISELDLNYEAEHFSLPINPIVDKRFSIRLELIKDVYKAETSDIVLRTLALETLDSLYPKEEWLRIYTDGSRMSGCVNAGAGVYCELFCLYTPIGNHRSAFDGEIAAICQALSQLRPRLNSFSKVVLLSDSKAALQAIDAPSHSRTLTIDNCLNLLNWLASNNKIVVLQWIPAHCGIQGNEAADFLAKKGASVLQRTNPRLPFNNIKCLIKNIFRDSFREELKSRNLNKSWLGQILDVPQWPRKRSVAMFRLISGHDCLRKHLCRINVVPDPLCTLCDLHEEMDLPHLSRCPALPRTSIWERYWIARSHL